MFTPRIYFPVSLTIGEVTLFDEKIGHYLSHVLRLRNEDLITIFNGQGGEYSAQLTFEKKKVYFTPTAFHDVNRSSSLPIHLGQALSRGDRMDFAIQKATELGVSSITPLFSQHSTVKLDEARSQKRMQHWQNIAISAAEQSGRTDVPMIHLPLPLKEWVAQPFEGTSILFDIGAKGSLNTMTPMSCVRIGIGPESGWSSDEHTLMKAHDFYICSLGPRILRTETACMAAITLIQGLFGDLS